MAYTLVSTEYIPPESGLKIIHGVQIGRIPRRAIMCGKGYFVVFGETVPPQFKFLFKDERENEYSFEAYSTIKKSMTNRNLTSDRRARIIETVKKVATISDVYEPEAWFETTVKALKI